MSSWSKLWENKPKYQEGDFAPCHYGDVTVDEPTGKYDERLDKWLEEIKIEGDKLQILINTVGETANSFLKGEYKNVIRDAIEATDALWKIHNMILGGEKSK